MSHVLNKRQVDYIIESFYQHFDYLNGEEITDEATGERQHSWIGYKYVTHPLSTIRDLDDDEGNQDHELEYRILVTVKEENGLYRLSIDVTMEVYDEYTPIGQRDSTTWAYFLDEEIEGLENQVDALLNKIQEFVEDE